MYLVWSARHLQDDDPAAEGTPPGWVRVCASCEKDWRGGGHAFCCPRVNPPFNPPLSESLATAAPEVQAVL